MMPFPRFAARELASAPTLLAMQNELAPRRHLRAEQLDERRRVTQWMRAMPVRRHLQRDTPHANRREQLELRPDSCLEWRRDIMQ